MNRISLPNPLVPGYMIQRLQFGGPESAPWEQTIPPQIPSGHRLYARWSGDTLELGIEPIPTGTAGAVKVSEDLSGKTMPELQTIAGMNGVKYEANTTKIDLIGRITAKRGVK